MLSQLEINKWGSLEKHFGSVIEGIVHDWSSRMESEQTKNIYVTTSRS